MSTSGTARPASDQPFRVRAVEYGASYARVFFHPRVAGEVGYVLHLGDPFGGCDLEELASRGRAVRVTSTLGDGMCG